MVYLLLDLVGRVLPPRTLLMRRVEMSSRALVIAIAVTARPVRLNESPMLGGGGGGIVFVVAGSDQANLYI